jgi:hypothetical protein
MPAGQTGREGSLDRRDSSPFSTRRSQLRYFRLRSCRDHQPVARDHAFSVRCRERGKLNEDRYFDALSSVSLSERSLRAAGTSKLLGRVPGFWVNRPHSDVAAILIAPRDGKLELDRNTGARLVLRETTTPVAKGEVATEYKVE